MSGDTNAAPDVFVRDLGTGTTSRVSVSSAGTQAGDDALNPSMSADGRYVAFYSTANNLVSGDTNNRGDIFVRDRTAGTTVRVNLSATGAQGNDTSNFPVISADGQVVAFHAKASSLVPGDTNAVRDVFVVGPAYAVVSSYTYDGDGLRLSASVDGTTSGWVWDVNAALPLLVTERDVSGDSLRDYTYGLGLTPLSMTSDAATSYYHTDALGSVRAISDASGDPQWSYAYAPFGTPLASDQIDPNAPDNPLRYTGQYLDPTGLYHLRARQYDPTVGRFLSTDPVAAAIGDPYVATYVYVANGPARYTDPSGRCFIVCGAAVGAVVGGLVSGVSYAITAGDEFSLSGLAGHALAGAAAGAISGATLGLASGVAVGGAALPAVERLALQGVGGYVGGLAGLAGSRLLGDPISGRGAVTQMVLSVTGAGVAPRMAPGSSFIDQFHWRSLFGTPQSAAATALGVGAGLAGTK